MKFLCSYILRIAQITVNAKRHLLPNTFLHLSIQKTKYYFLLSFPKSLRAWPIPSIS